MTLKTGIHALIDNLLMQADDLITTGTAQALAREVGYPNFDLTAYERSYAHDV